MITPTHVVVNAGLARLADGPRQGRLARGVRRLLPDRGTRLAFVAGGLAPDVGLTLLTAGAAIWFPATEGWTVRESMTHAFGTLFFEDPAWIAVHHTLHSPTVLVGLLAVAATAAQRDRRAPRTAPRRWPNLLLAFAAGCMVHTAADIPTHVDDGPLLLYPLDSSTRFHSPVSYYDPAYHGDIVAPIDLTITVAGSVYLLTTKQKRRRNESSHSRPTT